jgi:murein L,D-transpeptidase YcbB/YkuD
VNLRLPLLIAAILGGTSVTQAQVAASQREILLREALIRYDRVAATGGWAIVPRGARLEPGARDSRIALLRARLRAEDYSIAPAASEDSMLYDPALEETIRRFQRLHGLEEDGLVGPATLTALNASARLRAQQIEANLDPARVVPESPTDRYVLVNIAAFTLDLVEGDTSRLHLRVIVGRRDWPTPTLTSRATEVVFGPRWRVPTSIAIREILPTVVRDAEYFPRNSMRVFRDSGGRSIEIDPKTVDWASVPAAGFPYRLVQDEGPLNPLGGAKLVLQTRYDVYLHDTPTPRLFNQRRRALSHGCVRVENVVQLIARLLPAWPADSITAAMTDAIERRIRLPAPIPVHLVYWTAWPELDGLVAFRDDIYRLDVPPSRRR